MTAEQGYHFYPSRYVPAIGHEKLDVYLTTTPGGRVFDAAGFHVRVLDPTQETPSTLTVMHSPEFSGRSYRVALGRFWLFDFYGHSLEGFSFGGDLTLHCQDGETLCRFKSSAPVLELAPDSYDVERIFVDAVEAMAGVLRAEWRDGSDVEWLSSLEKVEPFSLFASSLVTLKAYLDELSLNGTYASDPARLKTWIKRAITTLRNAGEWPERAPTLAELEQTMIQARESSGQTERPSLAP